MDRNNIFRYPTALTIAGSDSGGGAGIQADLKTFSALGVFGISVITAITAQNTQTVYGIQAVTPDLLKKQIDAVFLDFTIDAVKIGMLHNKEAIHIVAESIKIFAPAYTILDPVMISTSGKKLLGDNAIHVLIDELFPNVALVTPNVDEAAYLSGINIKDEKDMEKAARCLQEMGCRSVLIKGGHLAGITTKDILIMPDLAPIHLEVQTVHTNNTHGTGCTLSSAIAAYLALGNNLQESVRMAKIYITNALSEGADVCVGNGHGALNHFFSPVPLQKIKLHG
ncbi:bifunctional hydroxymethylpyrimidine kinase/phosphomethylpyrimidine kinase [Parabacteroides chinchillae]